MEFIFRNKKCVVNQREVGSDTQSLQTALKNALRQAPDVILIGEIRDRETMSAAIAYAQSGHLCLATMHANNSYQALNRILSFYPVEVRPTMLGDLAAALKAVVSQRLLRTVSGGRAPAVEVMLNTKLIAELIEKGDFSGVKEAMEKSMAEGSQTFEMDIARMIIDGSVDRKEGLAYADSPTNLQWRLQNSAVGQALAARKAALKSPSSRRDLARADKPRRAAERIKVREAMGFRYIIRVIAMRITVRGFLYGDYVSRLGEFYGEVGSWVASGKVKVEGIAFNPQSIIVLITIRIKPQIKRCQC